MIVLGLFSLKYKLDNKIKNQLLTLYQTLHSIKKLRMVAVVSKFLDCRNSVGVFAGMSVNPVCNHVFWSGRGRCFDFDHEVISKSFPVCGSVV